ADWCNETGLKLIQILPVNDTIATHSWKDSYPYSAISAFALHPIYLRLSEIVNRTNQPLLDALEQKRKQLNTSPVLDYEAVLTVKHDFIKQIYPSQKEATFKSPDFQNFFKSNRDWLEPYACFALLRDKFGTPDFNQWPTHGRFDRNEIAKLAAPESPDYAEI